MLGNKFWLKSALTVNAFRIDVLMTQLSVLSIVIKGFVFRNIVWLFMGTQFLVPVLYD